MRQLSIKKPEGGNQRAIVVNSRQGDYNTMPPDFTIDIRIEVARPRCGYCGEHMQEHVSYRGGRGYGWTWHCPNWCHPDRFSEPDVIDLDSKEVA